MTDRPLLTGFNRLLLVAVGLLTVAGFLLVPLDATLPIHWGLTGEPDGFAPAAAALLLPLGMAVFTTALLFFVRPAGLRKDFEAGRHLIDVSISIVLALAIALCLATIAIGIGLAVDMPRLVAIAIGAMLLVLGNYLPKTQPNWIAGIRVPWTLRDPANWAVTHRWTGRLMMAGGIVALIAGIVGLPPVPLIATILAAAIVPAIAGIAISYALARRAN